MLRSGADGLWSITAMSLASSVVSLPIALLLPPVAPASWPYLGLATLLHAGYSLFLVRAYRHGDFGQVYPIARGTAPLLVTLGAAAFIGEQPSLAALLGIVLVSLGIVSLASAKSGTKPGAAGNALVTGLFIAAYTVNDGIASRLSGNALAYSSTLFLLYGIVMPIIYLAARRRMIGGLLTHEGMKALGGGAVSLVAYGLVIWAVTISPMGPVSALRETSVVFAALIARIFLREALTLRRLAASLVICLGAVCLGLGI
jgi:uncharacterized membrane protein